MYCLDSTFLIDLLKGKPEALALSQTLERFDRVTTPLNIFEVLSGLYVLKHHQNEHLEKFATLLDSCLCLPFNRSALERAARLHALLITKGQRIEAVDCLIVGTALAHGCTQVITRNKKDFERIPILTIISY